MKPPRIGLAALLLCAGPLSTPTLFLGLVVLAPSQVVITWNNVGTDFASTSNWAGGVVPANDTTTNIASFGAGVTNQPVLAANRSVAGIEFTSASTGTVALSGAGTLTLGAFGIVNSSLSGTKTVSAPITLATNSTFSNTGTLNVSGIGNVDLASNTLTLTGSGTAGTVSTGVFGTGSVTKTGTGKWIFSGTNTYTGGTTITSGALQIGNGGTTGSILGDVVNDGTLIFSRSNATTYTGNISGAGAVNIIGGSITLYGSNTYSGGTTIGPGFGLAGSGNAFGTGTVTLSGGSLVLAASAASGLANSLTIVGSNNGLYGSGGYTFAGNASGSGSLVLSSVTITGQLGHTGTTYLHSGAVYVSQLANGGAVSGIGASSSATSGLIIEGGTLFYVGGAVTTDRLFSVNTSGGTIVSSGTGALVFNNTGFMGFNGTTGMRALTLAGSNADGNTLAALIGDNGGATSIIKSGAGTWILTGANTYTGATTINGGNLTVTSVANGGMASSIGAAGTAATNLVLNNSTLRYTGTGHSTDRLFSVSAGGGFIDSSGVGALNFTNSGTLGFNGTTGARNLTLTGSNADGNTLAALVSDNGGATSIIKSGTSAWNLTGANTYTGATTITGGNLYITSVANGGSASNLGAASTSATNLVLNGGTLRYTGTGHSTDRLFSVGASEGAIVASGSGALNFTNTGAIGFNGQTGARTLYLLGTGNGSLAPIWGDNGGANTLYKGESGTWTLSGANTYTGATTVDAGTLRLGASNVLSNLTAVSVSSGATFDLNGNSDTVASLDGAGNVTLGSGTLTVAANSTTHTFSGVASGTGGLTKSGTSAWNLTGANTYTGATTITGGNLTITSVANGGSASNLGAASTAATNLVLNGGTLRYTGTGHSTDRLFSVGASEGAIVASGSGALNFTNTGTIGFNSQTGARTLYLLGTGNGSLAPIWGDNGGANALYKGESGTWTLSGANTYTGATTVDAGTLRLGASNVLSNSTAVSVSSGATLDLNGNNDTIGSLAGAGNVTLGSGRLTSGAANTSTTFSGVASGAGGLTKTGSGTLTLSGASTYTGETFIFGGTLSINSLANGGGNSAIGAAPNGAGYLVFANNGALTYTGAAASTDRLFAMGSGGATINASGTGALQFTNTGALTGNGQTDARTLTLGGTNADGNTFNPVIGDFTGATSVTKAGAGVWNLTAANTYTGATTINGGLLYASSLADGGSTSHLGASSNAASNLVLNGGTLVYTGAAVSTDRLFSVGTGNGGINASGSGTLSFTNTGAMGFVGSGARTLSLSGSGNASLAAIIGDNGGATSVSMSGPGIWILTGANTYTGGTTVSGGTLRLGASNVLSDSTAVSISTGATFDLDGYNDTVGSLTGTGNVTLGSGSLGAGASNASTTFSGVISGTGAFTKAGAGTLTLSGSNTFTGATTINAGTLVVTGSLASTSVSVASGATLTGTANFNDLSLSGTYAPGSSPALVSLDSLVMTSTGILQMEIGGTARGTEHDALDIAGAFTAAGTLDITFINAFAPTGPTTFNLFDFGSLSGTFDTINLPALGSGFVWDTTALYSAGELSIATAIPEPSTYAALFGLGALGLVFWRRRHAVRT